LCDGVGMKRFICLIVSLAVCLSLLSGCAAGERDSGKLSVVCTIFPQYDIVRNIAGDSVELKMLLPYSMESHDFKLENLSVKDLQTVSEADIIISVGGPSDSSWINELKKKVGNDTQKWVELSSMTETLCAEEHHHGEHDHDHDHSDNEIDEHIWTSPGRMVQASLYITNILKAADPEISSVCDKGLIDYITELRLMEIELSSIGQRAQKPIIFADRFSFRYLFHDYGLEYEAAFTGCSSSVDPSALQIASLTQKALDNKATTVFYMENSNTKYAQKIAAAVGAKTAMLHSCHNLSREEFKKGETYVSLMKKNINALKEAVK